MSQWFPPTVVCGGSANENLPEPHYVCIISKSLNLINCGTPLIPIMRSGAAAMFVLFLMESEPSGEDGREPCSSGRYSLADPRTLLWGESSAFNLPEPHYVCRVAP